MKQPTTVYVVTELKPTAVFYQKDIAEACAAQATTGVEDGAFEAFPIQVTTKNSFRKASKEAVLAGLTEDQKIALGLVKVPRKKRVAVK
jgi:hypothetical protein